MYVTACLRAMTILALHILLLRLSASHWPNQRLRGMSIRCRHMTKDVAVFDPHTSPLDSQADTAMLLSKLTLIDLTALQMAKPEQEDFDKTAAETAAALNLVVNNKIAAAQPKTLPAAPGAPQYIKYTPSQQGPQYNSGASHRIIRMQVWTGAGRPALTPFVSDSGLSV